MSFLGDLGSYVGDFIGLDSKGFGIDGDWGSDVGTLSLGNLGTNLSSLIGLSGASNGTGKVNNNSNTSTSPSSLASMIPSLASAYLSYDVQQDTAKANEEAAMRDYMLQNRYLTMAEEDRARQIAQQKAAQAGLSDGWSLAQSAATA